MRRRTLSLILVLGTAVAIVAAAPFVVVWRQSESLRLPSLKLPAPAIDNDAPRLESRGCVHVSHVASFRDELFAYLMFEHLKGSPPFQAENLVLRYRDDTEVEYEVLIVLPSDVFEASETACRLAAAGALPACHWWLAPDVLVERFRNQTRFFQAAYNLPARKSMEQLSSGQLHQLLRRFIRFKSTTDPRIRRQMEPVPTPLASSEAHLIAGDILAVADFFDLPLEYLLGVGAMENNYMNIRGDLQHSVWKRRAESGDIILERRKGRVRVLNYATGVWQITRETLRYVHRLYLKDMRTRDYSRLPEHLQPLKELQLDEVSTPVLTTYAGLLLRDLLDRFHGDIGLAVGAYNGGPGNPNMAYEEGVRAAALHARAILERAGALNGESVRQIPWLAAP